MIEHVSGAGWGDELTQAMNMAERNLQTKLDRRLPFQFLSVSTTHSISQLGRHYYTITYVINK